MKRLVILFMLCGLVLGVTSCGKHYSEGSRVGVVTKLSKKGVIFDSWEGELLIALPVDPGAVEAVQLAMRSGKRVELVYRQWWCEPPTIDSDYVIVEVKPIVKEAK